MAWWVAGRNWSPLLQRPSPLDTSHAPSAAVFIGAWFYFATEGTLVVDEVADDTIRGSFSFTATREDDAVIEIEVSGTCNRVPLGKE